MKRAQALVSAVIVAGVVIGFAAAAGLAWRVFAYAAGIG